jgi:ricin-type beta-trefoil lectin protein
MAPGPCAGSVQADQPYLVPCDITDARQQWEFSPSPSPDDPANYRQVRNVNYNMCLDARDAGGRVTGSINLRDCNGSANQAWDFQGGDVGRGYVCNWKKGNCSMKMEHTPPWNPDPNHRALFLADKYSHTGGWDIWYIWRPIVINPPNCQINPQSCA